MMRMITLGVFGVLFSVTAAAVPYVKSPKVMGLAGAGRSGIVSEPFSNPAVLAYQKKSQIFTYYGMPRVNDWKSGGKELTVGGVDGENEYAHAAFAYIREARPILLAHEGRGYRDRSTYTLAVGRKIFPFFDLGVTGRYVNRRDGGVEENFFDGDVGAIMQLFQDLHVGVTYENFAYRMGEQPPILGAGIHYGILGPIAATIDGALSLKGVTKNRKQMSYGFELALFGDVIGRGGVWQDSVNGLRGSSAGLSWMGPRTSFDYGVRMTRHAPVQREHTVGMTVQL